MKDIPPNILKVIKEYARTLRSRYHFADDEDLCQEGRVAYLEYVNDKGEELQGLSEYQRAGRICLNIFRSMNTCNEVTRGNRRSELARRRKLVKKANDELRALGIVEPTLLQLVDHLNRPQWTAELVHDALQWAALRLSGSAVYSPAQRKLGSRFRSVDAARKRLQQDAGDSHPSSDALATELNKPRWTVKQVQNALEWKGAVTPILVENPDIFPTPEPALDETESMDADLVLSQMYRRFLGVLDRMTTDLRLSEAPARRIALFRTAIEHNLAQVGLDRGKLEPMDNARLGARFDVSPELAKKDKERAVDSVVKYLGELVKDADLAAVLRSIIELLMLHQRAEPLSLAQRERLDGVDGTRTRTRTRLAAPQLEAFLRLCLGHISQQGTKPW